MKLTKRATVQFFKGQRRHGLGLIQWGRQRTSCGEVIPGRAKIRPKGDRTPVTCRRPGCAE